MTVGVAIIAGGEGRRLWPHTNGAPKALAEFLGQTLLTYQLERVAELNPTRVVVLLHSEAETIAAHLAGRASVLIESEPLGTAGGLCALPADPGVWVVINIDHVSDVDLVRLVAEHRGACTAVVTDVPIQVDEGVVTIDEGRLIRWEERPTITVSVTTGLYVFDRSAVTKFLDGNHCNMPEFIQRLMPDGVCAWQHDGAWWDVGTPQRLNAAAQWLQGRRSLLG